MIDLTDVKVGDTLFDPGIRRYSHHNTPRPRTLHVIKVARQYLYASEDPNITDIKDFRVERLDRKTGSANDWNNHTQGYHSEDEYKEHLYRIELTDKIKEVFGRGHVTRVPDITTAELRGIAKTLGVEF